MEMFSFVRFINVVLTGIIAGIVIGIFLGYNPATFSYPTYVEYQQGAIRSLNTLIPVLGLLTIIITLVSAIRTRYNKPVFILLLIAALLLIASGLVTRFGNQPINAIVMTWKKDTAPADWMDLRETWWTFHQVRTALLFVAFCLITWTAVGKRTI